MNKFVYLGVIVGLCLTPSLAGAQYYGSTYYDPARQAQISQIQRELEALRSQLTTLGYSSYSTYGTYGSSYPNPNYWPTINSNYYPTYNYGNYGGSVLGANSYNSGYSGVPACNFTNDLVLGSSGGEVSDLNRILTGTISTYFGQDTYNAVTRFQQQYAQEILAPAGLVYPTGVVGAFTRAKLNQVCNGIATNYGGQVLGASSYYPYNYNYQSQYQNQYQYQYPYNYNQYQYNYITPTVTLTSNAQSVPRGTGVTLNWTSNYATSCAASGGVWQGTKGQSGVEFVSRIDSPTTFVLTCTSTYSGLAGSASVTVNVY